MYAEAIEFIDVDGNSVFKDVFYHSLEASTFEDRLPRIVIFHQDFLRRVGYRDFLTVCEKIHELEYYTKGINYFISDSCRVMSDPLTLGQLISILLEHNGFIDKRF